MNIINQFFSKVVGSTFCPGAQEAIRLLKPNDKLVYAPEPTNKFDANAIAIYNEAGQRLGYIPKETAKGLKGNLDNGCVLEIIVSEITGAGKDNVGCNISITTFGEGDNEEDSEKEDTSYGLQMETGI